MMAEEDGEEPQRRQQEAARGLGGFWAAPGRWVTDLLWRKRPRDGGQDVDEAERPARRRRVDGLEETNGDGELQRMGRHGLGGKRGWLAAFMGFVTFRQVRRRLFGATEATRGGENASKQAAHTALVNDAVVGVVDAGDDDETTNLTPRRRPRPWSDFPPRPGRPRQLANAVYEAVNALYEAYLLPVRRRLFGTADDDA